MMRRLIAVAFVITVSTAATARHNALSCEERGGHHEYLESVTGGDRTPVCVPSIVEVTPVDE